MYQFIAQINGNAIFQRDGQFYADTCADPAQLMPGSFTRDSTGMEPANDTDTMLAGFVARCNSQLNTLSISAAESDRARTVVVNRLSGQSRTLEQWPFEVTE